MFDNNKLDYATIILGDKRLVEGRCSWWSLGSSNGTYIKLIIEGKPYMTGIENVLLTEDPNK